MEEQMACGPANMIRILGRGPLLPADHELKQDAYTSGAGRMLVEAGCGPENLVWCLPGTPRHLVEETDRGGHPDGN